MVEHDYAAVDQRKGSASQHSIADPTAFERANYMRTLSHYSTAGPASPASSRYPPKEPTMRVADWVDW